MSNLKRKREEGEESGLDDTTSPVKSPTNASTHGADEPSPSKAPIGATNGTYKAETSPAGDSAETGDSLTILICGEEVVLKGTGGRKKRKCSRDTLILTAYKGRLARMCRADNMSSALEIYKEMQAKGIKQDLETHLMILAVCGGSPGGKDELEPGNGATQAGAARAHDTKASEGERRESGAGSAQKNSSTAADAAIQIFTELSKDPEHTLPESAYTSVIRACCLDGRADAGRETLGALTRNGGLPRLRTFSPLLEAYARENGRLQDCMSLWQEATSPPHEITMTEREYLFLIKACTAVKDVRCFEEVMKEYMEDVLQPRSRAAWDVIKAWFRVAPTESPRDTGTSLGDVKECTVASSSAGSVSPVEHGKDDGPSSSPCTSSALVGQSLVESEVTDGISEGHDGAVDSSGPNPGARPDGGEAEDGAGGDEEIAVNPTKGPVESDVAVEESGGAEAAGGFRGWRVSECTVADDGTCRNCGEKLKSIELSEDDEERLRKQIEVLVCTNEERTKQWKGYCGWLERRGRSRYNVIIDGANVGYFKQNAADAGELADLKQIDWAVKKYEGEGKKPLVVLHSRHLVPRRLSSENKDILKRWKEAETIQSCAPKNNDDWYWLYAAVFAGGRVLVLTNDEMRDHHFSMLSHRSFERWKERHQTRFNFGEWEDDMREVIVEEPCVYSKRSQRSSDSWHFPLKDSPDWLCVRRGVPAESS